MYLISRQPQVLDFLQKNPWFIAGFVNGEGCFTSSAMVNQKAKWGLWPQFEFNVSQLTKDVVLLQAINEFFGGSGSIYHRKDGVSKVMFRDLSILQSVIIPFFDTYPLVGMKHNDYILWKDIIALISSKQHLSDSLSSRHIFLQYMRMVKILNGRDTRANTLKLKRNDIIVSWLNNLTDKPTLADKQNLIILIKTYKKFDA